MDDDDPLGPARGCALGVVLGAALWALLILAVRSIVDYLERRGL